MRVLIKTECPYCDVENRFSIKVHPYRNWQVHWCERDIVGGCDLPFVIETETEVTIIAIAHPIESITKDRKE